MTWQLSKRAPNSNDDQAVFSIFDGELKTVTKRNNSLGTSKTPCHTCRASARWCDRQRPKCGSCLRTNQNCGYTLDVRWKSPKMVKGPLGTSDSESRVSAVPYSISPFGDSPPTVSEALDYHQHCFVDMTTATAGCRLNPLRSVLPLVVGSTPLQHAMILLAATHRQQPMLQLMTLRSKALKNFAKILPRIDDITRLAVILVLLFADFVHSGKSEWSMHLSAVAKILENMHEGKDRRSLLQEDSYRAMVLQFYWFDIMNALLSARQPNLPAIYLEDALRINGEYAKSKVDSISFDVFGFTERMFLVLSRLVRGHDDSIDEVETLETPDVSRLMSNGWTLADAEERVHVEEIWKHATVIYLMTRHSPYGWTRQSFEVHARQVFEHAWCFGPSSSKRRRILFPLLFAGSCTPYSERRDFMQRYCVECFNDTKFGVFQMGLGILRQVWMLRLKEEEERKTVGGRAYSCWRNVTAVTENPFVS